MGSGKQGGYSQVTTSSSRAEEGRLPELQLPRAMQRLEYPTVLWNWLFLACVPIMACIVETSPVVERAEVHIVTVPQGPTVAEGPGAQFPPQIVVLSMADSCWPAGDHVGVEHTATTVWESVCQCVR